MGHLSAKGLHLLPSPPFALRTNLKGREWYYIMLIKCTYTYLPQLLGSTCLFHSTCVMYIYIGIIQQRFLIVWYINVYSTLNITVEPLITDTLRSGQPLYSVRRTAKYVFSSKLLPPNNGQTRSHTLTNRKPHPFNVVWSSTNRKPHPFNDRVKWFLGGAKKDNLWERDNLSTTDKSRAPNLSFIQRFHCITILMSPYPAITYNSLSSYLW